MVVEPLAANLSFEPDLRKQRALGLPHFSFGRAAIRGRLTNPRMCGHGLIDRIDDREGIICDSKRSRDQGGGDNRQEKSHWNHYQAHPADNPYTSCLPIINPGNKRDNPRETVWRCGNCQVLPPGYILNIHRLGRPNHSSGA